MIEKNVSWEDIDNGIDSIVEQVNNSGHKYDWVIGVNRGGLIPSVMVSHRLGVRHGVITVTHYDGQKLLKDIKKDLYVSMVGLFKHHHRVLIVDDIADSGVCLRETKSAILRIDPDVKNMDTATLHYKTKSIVKPDYYAEEISDEIWLNYPWEKSKVNELQREAVASM